MKTKMRRTVGAGIISAATLCGCDRHSEANRNLLPQKANAPAPTEWNNDATKLSPFTKVRFEGGKVMVTYLGLEYELEAVNGLPVPGILDFCKREYGEKWQRRFAEDLVPVLNNMRHPINPDHTVNLSLIDSQSGQSKDIADAAMTEENRQAVHRAFVASHSAE